MDKQIKLFIGNLIAVILATFLGTASVWACACGCGVFDVGTSSMFPLSSGGLFYLGYDFMDQSQNRSQTGTAPASANDERDVRSSFYTANLDYMFNRNWGVNFVLPYESRYRNAKDASGNVVSSNHSALGDVELMAMYTGIADDMSSGIMFGLKLPTGDSSFAGFDQDSEIGAGGTDLLLGAYHMGAITTDNMWSYFTQIKWDQPLAGKAGYLAGEEVDIAAGSYYNGWTFGANKIAPLLQLVASFRASDEGIKADSGDTGYERLYVSPGIEGNFGAYRLYAQIEVPTLQYFNGYQLAAPILYKTAFGFSF